MQIESKKYPITGYASSLIGGRPENQDDVGWTDTPHGFLLVVCDGMGGGPGGKMASYLAKQVFMQTIYESSPQASREDVIKLATSRANDVLYRKMDEEPHLRGMGSTLVAVLVNEDSAAVAHLGDSRCYRMNGSKLAFRTRDHSLVAELVMAKALNEEQARLSPQSNVITRALGNTSNHVAEITFVPYQKGDRFFLCTDGVWGEMPHPDLLQRLGNGVAMDNLVENLQREIDNIGTTSGGHYDNHTLAVIEMGIDSTLKDKWNMKTKTIFATLAGLLLLSILCNGALLFRDDKSGEVQQLSAQVEKLTRQCDELRQSLVARTASSDQTYKQQLTENESLRENEVCLQGKVDSLQEQNDSLRKESVLLRTEIDKLKKKSK
ncbi:MAG: protein phosphatase 2C domain-containing protein [Bacteroidaceae bacterium]|nr:protein phosphatase 2C domain-containing protein [Bacteroidaceae bacterium]